MFELTQFPLPYAPNTLTPYISEQTLNIHHGRHLATYIKNLNNLVTGTVFEKMPLHEIIKKSEGKIFNNAAQVFNHDFFFNCMQPNGGGDVPTVIADKFGGPEKFYTEFSTAAANIFGSGWVWLVRAQNDFRIITTANADTPIAHGFVPLLTLDVWEHAYYLDYQNRRADFIAAFLNNLVNWNFVMENMSI